MLWWTLRKLRSGDSTVRKSAAEKLGETKDPGAVEPLVSALQDENYSVRRAAAEALGELDDARALEPLVAVLKDTDTFMRAAAAKALEQIDSNWTKSQAAREAVSGFLAALEDKDWDVRRAAVEALNKIGDARAIESLVVALKNSDNYVRQMAEDTLKKINPNWTKSEGSREATLSLMAALKDSDSGVRKRVAEALGKIGDARAVEPLVAALNDKYMEVQRAAVEALNKIGNARAVQPLVATLKDKDGDVRQAAAKALESLGWQPCDDTQRALLSVTLRNWDEAVSFGDAAVEPLVAALKDKDGDVRQAAAKALESLGWQSCDDSQRALLSVTLRNWDKAVSFGDAAVEPLVAAIEDKDSFVRSAAAAALGEIGDSRAVEPLVAALKDENNRVEEAAVKALKKMRDARAADPLVAALVRRVGRQWEARAVIGELEDILQTRGCHVSLEVLRAVASISGVTQSLHDLESGNTWEEPVDCSKVKELARYELDCRRREA